MLGTIIKWILRIVVVLYLGVSFYFLWQYWQTPELKFCYEYPTAKLMTDLPESWRENELVASTSAKLGEVVEQGKKVLEFSGWLREQVMEAEEASKSGEVAEEGGGRGVVEVGAYLYCKEVVEGWERQPLEQEQESDEGVEGAENSEGKTP